LDSEQDASGRRRRPGAAASRRPTGGVGVEVDSEDGALGRSVGGVGIGVDSEDDASGRPTGNGGVGEAPGQTGV
jgi:hypothetical protein